MTNHTEKLHEAQQRLKNAQDVQRRRLDLEAQEKADIAEAERQLQVAQKQKAESDWQNAIHANAALHTQNLQARDEFRASLDNVLVRFKELLSGLNDTAIHTTADEMQRQVRGAVGNRSKQTMIDYQRSHADQSGHEAAAQVRFQVLGDIQVLKAPWAIEQVLAAWARDAADPQERRARLGVVYALYGGELEAEASRTDLVIQAQLDNVLHDRLSGGRA